VFSSGVIKLISQRHCGVSDVSVSKLNDILTSGAGGVLLLIPKNLPQESKESVQALEEYLLSTEIEVPVYFAEESEDLEYLVSDVIKKNFFPSSLTLQQAFVFGKFFHA
jgi:hypothetical protein